MPVWDIIHKYGPDYRVIFVGDASMSPYEVMAVGGSVEHFNEEPGAVWMKRLTNHFQKVIWLNPEHPFSWGTGDSDMNRYMPFCSLVRVCNTLEHLDRAIGDLLKQQS